MQPAKIIYFIAGLKPTTDEQTEINAILAAQIYVAIRTDLKPAMYGATAEDCDYVAGSVPASHTGKPVWTGAIVSPTQTLVNSGDDVAVDFGSAVPALNVGLASVVDHVLTVEFDGTIGTVKDQQPFVKSITVDGVAESYTVTPTVVDGSITTMTLVKVV